MIQKIIIFGFPHCGTTVLRSIIGHIDSVYDLIDETEEINNLNLLNLNNKKYILCKFPVMVDFQNSKYDDYIKIFIIRNPLYAFSSINKRFDNIQDYCHSMDNYINTVRHFYSCVIKPIKNVYTIRYEDMFNDDYHNLKKLLNKIGFNYTNDIFDNSKYINYSHGGAELVNYVPNDKEHVVYRNWQINQKFENNNIPSKIFLTEEQKKILLNNKDILKVYPNLSL